MLGGALLLWNLDRYMKKALITGHLGFIGSNFTSYLETHGWETHGCDIKSPDGRDCRDLFKTDTTKYDLVIHAAAIVGGRETIENEPLSVAADLAIDSDAFNWAVRTGQPRFLYFSSSAAYPMELQGIFDRLLLKEDDIDPEFLHVSKPDLTYGWVKLTGEMLAGFARKAGVNVTVVRPFSGYGETQDLTYPFPSFIQRALNRDNPFQIWGDGTQCRDFIHVDDVVKACMALVESGTDEPVNLATGRDTSFLELARIVTRQSSYTPAIELLLNKPVGAQYRVGDPSRLLKYYVPSISVEEGVRRALLKGLS